MTACTRRQSLAWLGASLALPAAAAPRADAPSTAPFGTHPLLRPLEGWSDGLDRLAEGVRVQGRWPAALRGTLYRNGPGLMGRAGQRYQHWFDGDGLVQAWQFGAQGVRHQARFVQTRKFKLEQAAAELLLPAFGTAVPARRSVRSSDDVNVANTSVVLQGGRLYALWEGGSATELDPQSLATIGPKRWSPELAGLPFSAHPKRERDGTLWNFGTFAGKLVLYEIAPDGRLRRSALLELPMAAMVHDFAVSQRFITLLLPPLSLDMAAVRGGASMVSAMRWDAGAGMRAVVIDKASLSLQRQFELPAELVFHFGNAWDEGDTLHLDYVRNSADEFMSGRLNSILQGQRADAGDPSPMRLLSLDLARGRVLRHESLADSVEFPQVDPRVVAQRHRYLYQPARIGAAVADRWGFNAVQRWDLERQRGEHFAFGPQVVVEEQLLVPKPGSAREGQGWLVGTGFDAQRRQSFCTVFDAEAVGAGPLATAWLPYWVPLGFHGAFAPA